MRMMNPFVMVSRLDMWFLKLAAVRIVSRRLPWDFGFSGYLQSKEAVREAVEVGTTHQGMPRGVVPPSMTSHTASSPYKYAKNPETLGESRNTTPATASSRTTRSNLDTITEGFIILIGASPMMREQFTVDLRVHSQQLDGFISLFRFSIQWSLGDLFDVTLVFIHEIYLSLLISYMHDYLQPRIYFSNLVFSQADQIDFSCHWKRCFVMGSILRCLIPVTEGEPTRMYHCY